MGMNDTHYVNAYSPELGSVFHLLHTVLLSFITPRAHAQQGVKQSFCPSVVVVVKVVPWRVGGMS